MFESAKTEQVVKEKNSNLNILCVSERRWTGSGCMTTQWLNYPFLRERKCTLQETKAAKPKTNQSKVFFKILQFDHPAV